MPGRRFPIDLPLLTEVGRLSQIPWAERDSLPRHRHRLSREEVEAAQRARVLVATAEVVADAGYARATTKEIVARAGVSSKTFYALYKSKEDAFMATYTLLDGVVIENARGALTSGDLNDAVHIGFGGFLATLAAAPLFTFVHTVEARAAGPRVLQRRTEVFGELVAILREALTAASKTNSQVAVPSDAVLMGLVGGIGELILQHVVAHDVASLPDLLPAVVDLFERTVLRS